jgi:predicted permease
MLGVRPLIGRTFLPGEDVVGGPRVTMLSHATWMTRFGGRPEVLGETIRITGEPYEIIGVLPEEFTLERGKPAAPFWIPAGQEPGDVGKRNRSFIAIAALKPGVTPEQANAETARLLDSNPVTKHGVRIMDFVRDETRDIRAPMLILLGAVGLLLLIACVNIATLLLGEVATRDAEISARVALGASRGRVVTQLLTESLVLSALGSAPGILLAWWGTRGIVALAPEKIPGIQGVHVDGRVLAVSLVLATLTGLLFGLAPAASVGRNDGHTLLRSGHVVRGGGRLQRFMIAAELALSVVLLLGAGLLARSFNRLTSVDPGFRSDNLLTVNISFAGRYWEDTTRLRSFYERAVPAIAALPGIESVALVSQAPFGGGFSSNSFLLPGEGDAERKSHKHQVQQRTVSANYFAVMGIAIIAGRSFSPEDRGGAELVAIISEAAARRDFPNASPLGQRVFFQGAWRTIVGIAKDVKVSRLSADNQPSIYTPAAQRQDLVNFALRVRGEAPVTEAVRRAVRETDPLFLVTKTERMETALRRSFAEERFRTMLIVLFGVMAAALAAVGMYGVTDRAVTRRVREMGIRVALGAAPDSVISMIVRQTLSGVGLGVLIGAVASVLVGRVLAPYLFGVTAHDPATYAGIFAFLAVVALASTWIPARRAGQVQPAAVLRE